jgi:hypothetical protein
MSDSAFVGSHLIEGPFGSKNGAHAFATASRPRPSAESNAASGATYERIRHRPIEVAIGLEHRGFCGLPGA